MKKVASVFLALLLCFGMQLGAFADSATLKTVVPDTHEITVAYNDGGYVLRDGSVVQNGAAFSVARFDSLRLDVIAKMDSHLKSVRINGQDVTDQLAYGQLTIASVNTDMHIVFTFEKCADAENPTDPDEPTTDPDEPTTDPDEPTTDPDEPTTDPDEPTTDPDEPTTDPDEPTTEPAAVTITATRAFAWQCPATFITAKMTRCPARSWFSTSASLKRPPTKTALIA